MPLFAFDGTWNYRYGQPHQWNAEDTNVVKFFDAYVGDKYYFEGVGSEPGNNAVMEILGGAFGTGGKSIIHDAYMQLAKDVTDNGVPGNLDVIGYSRGAALAVHFTNLIREIGVPDLNTKKKKRVRRGAHRRRGPRRYKTVITYERYQQVKTTRFLGLWDTVPAFGIPFDIGPIPTNRINIGYRLSRPKGVCTYHAMALDENRSPFQVQRMKGAVETWFRGVHSNIGGNFQGDEGLSDIALLWMIHRAKARGIKFDTAALATLKPDITGQVRHQASGHPAIRRVLPGDRIHVSVPKGKYRALPWRELRIDRTGG
jgi:uncharacterized protein (DUF2235 family)